MRRPLSPRQADVLAFVASYIDTNGVTPTYKEIGARIGIPTPSAVLYHLQALQLKGYIEKGHYTRIVRLLDEAGDPIPHPTPRPGTADGLPPLTRRQAELMEFIAACLRDRGRPPTTLDIMGRLGFRSKSTLDGLVSALVRKGYLERIGGGGSWATRVLAVPG